jgi:hypothetical protein
MLLWIKIVGSYLVRETPKGVDAGTNAVADVAAMAKIVTAAKVLMVMIMMCC